MAPWGGADKSTARPANLERGRDGFGGNGKRCPMRKDCVFFLGRSRQFACMFVQAVGCCCCCCCCCSWNFLAGNFLDFFVFAFSRSPYRTIGGCATVLAGCFMCLLHQVAGRKLLRRLRPQERQVHQCQAMETHVSSKPLVVFTSGKGSWPPSSSRTQCSGLQQHCVRSIESQSKRKQRCGLVSHWLFGVNVYFFGFFIVRRG